MRRLILVLILVLAGHAQAGPYLPDGTIDAQALIGPPPALGSPAFEEGMAVVMWLQRTRTPAQVAFVRETLDLERFAPLIAPELVAVDGMALKQALDAAIDDVRTDYDRLKDIYDLPRPFLVSDQVEPAVEPRPVASYPSGHAIRAVVYARLLAEIFPDRRDPLMALALQIGYGRVIAGVHYPFDVVAGQALGNAYADAIVAQPAFEDALAQIRRAAGTRPGD